MLSASKFWTGEEEGRGEVLRSCKLISGEGSIFFKRSMMNLLSMTSCSSCFGWLLCCIAGLGNPTVCWLLKAGWPLAEFEPAAEAPETAAEAAAALVNMD